MRNQKEMQTEVKRPEFESQLPHLLAVWSWVIRVASLSLSFLICKMGVLLMMLTSGDFGELRHATLFLKPERLISGSCGHFPTKTEPAWT